jgi:peptide/nickel transport system substrate-binding protein
MRERAFLWDLASLFLLGLLVASAIIHLKQNDNIERLLTESRKQTSELQATNREILSKLEQGISIANKNPGSTHTQTQQPSDADKVTPISGTLYDGRDLPKVVRGDEKADDGDWLTLNAISEPNSLNTIVDNDATVTEFFALATDTLVTRSWDDFSKWQPKLARAWEKALVLRGVAAAKNAPELAKKLEAGLTEQEKKEFQIGEIKADGDAVLEVRMRGINTSYREAFNRVLGVGAIAEQHWIYVSFNNGDFLDNTPITGETVGKRIEAAMKKAGVKAETLAIWPREGSAVLMVTGDGEGAAKAIQAYVNSSENKGLVTDPKSATGKREDKVLIYDLAEKYQFQEKPVFTFHLRKDVKWHDGEPFTGKDVIFSFNTVMNPKIEAAPQRSYLQDCESCTLVNGDPYIVQYTWRKPYFLSFNFSAALDIMPEHYFKFTNPDEFNKGPKNQTLVGNGAYRLERWDRKEQIVFVRNDNYYGTKPHFKKVVYRFVQDRTVGMKMLEAGDLDLQPLTKAQTKDKLEDPKFKEKFNLEISTANNYRYIGWNCRQPRFSTEKTRRALSMLVDRERIVNDIYRGFALSLKGPVHPEDANYSPEIEKLSPSYDLEGAKKLLAEDGWKDTDGDGVIEKNGEAFKFALLYPAGSPEYESIANLIKNTFAQAGIVVTPANMEWSVFLQKIERLQFDAMMLGWRLSLDSDPYQLWHSSQTIEKGSNHCAFVSTDADRLIEAGRRELDDEKRREMFRKVYAQIVQSQPYTFLLVDKRTVGYDKRIQNVVYKLVGADQDRWWVPKALQKNK